MWLCITSPARLRRWGGVGRPPSHLVFGPSFGRRHTWRGEEGSEEGRALFSASRLLLRWPPGRTGGPGLSPSLSAHRPAHTACGRQPRSLRHHDLPPGRQARARAQGPAQAARQSAVRRLRHAGAFCVGGAACRRPLPAPHALAKHGPGCTECNGRGGWRGREAPECGRSPALARPASKKACPFECLTSTPLIAPINLSFYPPPCAQGPQYVVTDFNIFVCAVCSGVQYVFFVFLSRIFRPLARAGEGERHSPGALLRRRPSQNSPLPKQHSRQFNHRCKGVTMATFKPEEIAAIEDGGNAVRFFAFFSSSVASSRSGRAAQR